QSAMKIVKDVGAIRNSFGSGHGRQREPVVEQEMADIVVAATLLWVRWVLRRIEPLILGQPTALIRDLRDGLTFYRGDLTERLRASGLASLERDLTPCVGHAQSQECAGGSEMIQPDGKEKLPR
ncbi:abortive infection family protein, partial [Mycobacteroides abscessus]|uniref:abortive infection family protein n=1 Tax=Mycobacteroides abscessus TaxID=36809 RepID=UPI0010542397